MQELATSVSGSFDEKAIHDLRVEYKKLRAFLRLIAIGNELVEQFFPEDFKNLYHAAGNIRTNQLLRKKIKTLHVSSEALPVFFNVLDEQQQHEKNKLTELSTKQDWDNLLLNWINMLPTYLTNSMIEKFVKYKVTAIRIAFLYPYEEENLHTIRKHIKDLIYNIRLFEKVWGIPLPYQAWTDEQLLVQAAETLGDFNDEASAITTVEQNSLHMPTVEKEVLSQACEKWKIEKADIFHELIDQIPALQLELPKR